MSAKIDSDIRKIALAQIKGLDLGKAEELLSRVGGLDVFYELSTRQLWTKLGSQPAFCSDSRRSKSLEDGEAESNFLVQSHAKGLYFEDDDYPRRLHYISDAPVMLYQLGDCDLNAKHIVSVVGTRRASAYGQRMARELVLGLAERLDDLVIVSGLAYGIDISAHRAALEAGVPTVAVVAHGLRTIYPADHRDYAARIVRQGGAIITEYVSNAPIHRGNFLARNRIVAGLADCTVIVESAEKGGAMSTAALTVGYGRELAAFPGRATDSGSAGPNRLIKSQRASMICDADDLIRLMEWRPRANAKEQRTLPFESKMANLTPEQLQLVDYLRSHEGASVNEMANDLGLSLTALSPRLVELELADIITGLPGSAYSLNI